MTHHVSIESCENGAMCSQHEEHKSGGEYKEPEKMVFTDHASMMAHIHKHTKHMFPKKSAAHEKSATHGETAKKAAGKMMHASGKY